MPFGSVSLLPPPPPTSRVHRYLLALGVVTAATLLRFAADPLVGDRLPYFIYVPSVVVVTWLCGVDGGVLATAVAALVGNYFFVPVRYEFVPHRVDWLAMGIFSAVAIGLVWFVGRLRRAEALVRELHARARQRGDELQATLDTVPAAVFVTRDADARRMTGNQVAADYLRLPADANMSKTAPDAATTYRIMKDGRELAGDELPVQSAMAQGSDVRDLEFDVVYGDGSRRTLFGNAKPLRDERGSIRGSVGAFIDVTERKRMEGRLREQTEELAQANRLKDEFLATLSHELRTPLNAIIGWSDMLRQGKVRPDARASAIESIYRNGKLLRELINDVLDVSRITTGKVRLESQPLDIPALLKNAIDSVRPAADAKALSVVTDFGAVPFPVSGDPTRMQQVFWNLLSNAVKFSAPGGTVHVSMQFGDRLLQIQVADTGIGISADFLPHVFERFRQKDSSSRRTHTGLGLGLAIVRHLVELHGGAVRAESDGEGKGATFTVTLPAQPFAERRHEERPVVRHVSPVEPVVDDPPTLCGLRVLVVDDNRDARELAASVLRYHGAIVTVSAAGADALEKFDAFKPGVMLVDLAMPDMDGFDFIDRIRTSHGPTGVAVAAIAFTAYAREEDRRRALKSGFQLHLTKPVDSHTLVRAVASVRP